MAKVKGLDIISGSTSNLIFYTRQGGDQVFVRRKGGPTREQVKTKSNFSEVRKSNKEFGGCSRMSKAIRETLRDLGSVADYNLSSVLCAWAKRMQKCDETGEVGRRSILLSEHRDWLRGFDFNRRNRYDNLLRVPLRYTLDRDTCSATISFPDIDGLQHLHPTTQWPLFRIEVALGALSDMHYDADRDEYVRYNSSYIESAVQEHTGWFPVGAQVPGQEFRLSLAADLPQFGPKDTLVLSVAVRMGTIDVTGQYVAVKTGGAGKIVDLG